VGKKEFTKALSPDGEDRLRVRINVDKGKVVDVVVQYESKIKEKWYPIVRYDCSHGFFHRDLLDPKGKETKQSISIQIQYPAASSGVLYVMPDLIRHPGLSSGFRPPPE
jgi:hypothetical protein